MWALGDVWKLARVRRLRLCPERGDAMVISECAARTIPDVGERWVLGTGRVAREIAGRCLFAGARRPRAADRLVLGPDRWSSQRGSTAPHSAFINLIARRRRSEPRGYLAERSSSALASHPQRPVSTSPVANHRSRQRHKIAEREPTTRGYSYEILIFSQADHLMPFDRMQVRRKYGLALKRVSGRFGGMRRHWCAG